VSQNDILYSERWGLKYDLYEPERQARGVVVVIHGGGWIKGDKSTETPIATQFTKAGYVVIAPNYRLAPTHLYPAPLEDLAYFFSDEFRANLRANYQTDQIAAFGGSAGGNLAIEMAARHHVPAISWSGIIDIEDWLLKHQNVVPADRDFHNLPPNQVDQSGRDDVYYKFFTQAYVGHETSRIVAASLLNRMAPDIARCGPLYLANSTDELVPVDGMLMLAEKLSHFGRPVVCQQVPGNQHALGYRDVAWPLTIAWLNQQMAQK
jgi:acetyl esterase/lipase